MVQSGGSRSGAARRPSRRANQAGPPPGRGSDGGAEQRAPFGGRELRVLCRDAVETGGAAACGAQLGRCRVHDGCPAWHGRCGTTYCQSTTRIAGARSGRAFSRRACWYSTRGAASSVRLDDLVATARQVGDGHRVGHRRQGRSGQAGADRPARRGAPAHRGRARRGQDHARQGAGPVHRLLGAAHPVHPRPAAERHHRGQRLQPGTARVRVQAGAGVRQHRGRRRDQPGLAQDPVRAARVHGRAAGHRRRHHLPAARRRSW